YLASASSLRLRPLRVGDERPVREDDVGAELRRRSLRILEEAGVLPLAVFAGASEGVGLVRFVGLVADRVVPAVDCRKHLDVGRNDRVGKRIEIAGGWIRVVVGCV